VKDGLMAVPAQRVRRRGSDGVVEAPGTRMGKDDGNIHQFAAQCNCPCRDRKAILGQAGRAFKAGKPMQNFASGEAKFCMSSVKPGSGMVKEKSSRRTLVLAYCRTRIRVWDNPPIAPE
jgi:hypothetical protein